MDLSSQREYATRSFPGIYHHTRSIPIENVVLAKHLVSELAGGELERGCGALAYPLPKYEKTYAARSRVCTRRLEIHFRALAGTTETVGNFVFSQEVWRRTNRDLFASPQQYKRTERIHPCGNEKLRYRPPAIKGPEPELRCRTH